MTPANDVRDDIRFLEAELAALRLAAEEVCWFDWSNNDPDAVRAIERLRKILK